MYVRLKSSYQVVTLPEDFLTLRKVDGDDLTFELKYGYDQEVGLKANVTSVSVEVAKELPPVVTDVPKSKNKIGDILRFRSLHLEKLKAYQVKSVLATLASDPTKAVSNEVVSFFNRGYASEQIPQLMKKELTPVLVADAKNAITPVNAQHDMAVTGETHQQVAEELLLRGLDPSSAYSVNELGLTLAEAHRGIQRRSPSVFRTEAEKALYKYKNLAHLKPILQDAPGEPGFVVTDEENTDRYVLERVAVDGRVVSVKDSVKFTFASTTPDKLFLIINVKDKAGVTVQQLSRVFYPRDYVKYFTIPTTPPVMKVSNRSDRAYAMLALKQVDTSASRVRLYKRVYDHHSVSDEPYVFVSEFELTPTQGWKYVPVEVSLGNTTIYRAVPVSSLGALGADFSSIIVKPKNVNPSFKRVVITTKPLASSVQLEVSKLPSDAVSFQIMREDFTLDRGTLEFIETPVRVETADPNRVYTLEDDSVKQNHVYAYHCRIYRRNGSHETRQATVYEHVPLVENIVDTKVTDPSLLATSFGYDVQFTITTTVVNTNVDQLKKLLEKQGMYDIFSSDVSDVRNQLGKLIAHNVRRVDLTTGVVEDFGTVDTDTFSDLTLRKVAGVSELRLGHKYRYIVTALLRAPETLLESYVKTATDSFTRRTYQYQPFKFFHPIVSKYGSMVTANSVRTNYSKDPMMFGEIGAYTIAEVALDKERSIINGATKTKRGSDVDILTWALQGSFKDVDHFQIIAEHGGSKTVVGKATCVPETENFVYVRRLDQTEVGLDIRYYVCPVYHDFSRGLEVLVSNTGENS